ncbi:MAG: VOC family protein [Verrucomicrobiota bacterium]
MSTNTLVWTDIPVTDLPRAVTFYTKVLGQEVHLHDLGDVKIGVLPHPDQTSVSGCLVPAMHGNAPSRTGPLIYLSVEGRLDDAAQVAAANGGEVLQPKHGIGPYGFRVIIADSEGNRIALHSQTA